MRKVIERKNEKKSLRRRLATAGTVFALLLGAVGCGASGSADSEAPATEAKVEATEEATEEVTEAATESVEKEVEEKDIVAASSESENASSTDSAVFVYTGEPVTIKVGASITPHAEVLREAAPILAEQGITLEVVEIEDSITPNIGVTEGSLDANYFQHVPYLEQYNEENGTDIVSIGAVHYEPFGVYAGRTTSLADLPDGAVVAVPKNVAASIVEPVAPNDNVFSAGLYVMPDAKYTVLVVAAVVVFGFNRIGNALETVAPTYLILTLVFAQGTPT